MPGWGLIITTVSKSKVGQAVWWVGKQFGLDKVIELAAKAVERGVSRIGERRMAILKARHTKNGKWAPVVVEGRTRWVVYSASTPIEIFPPIKGDLGEAMQTFDTNRLRHSDEVPSARAMAWARARLGRLGGKDGGGDGDPSPSQLSEAQAVRDALATAGQEGGQEIFHAMVDELPKLLEQLASAPAKAAAATNGIPEKPGVYLFRDGVNPVYVGQAGNLRSGLREHTAASSRENQAPLAWRIALKGAPESDAEFAEHFRDAKQHVAAMDVQFIELDDPVTRTVFEVYAARALGTDEFDSLETH